MSRPDTGAVRAFLEDNLDNLSGLHGALGAVLHAREDDFIALGERLTRAAMDSSEMKKLVGELTTLTSEASLARFTQELKQDLERMRAFVQQAGVADTIERLGAIQTIAAELEQLLGDFGRIVRSLQMLGISTRIESARLGAAGRGFSTLADDVEGLAVKIVTYTDQIREQFQTLATMSSRATEKSRAMERLQASGVEESFQELAERTETLLTLAEDSREVGAEIAPLARQIAASMGEMVTSMQFHDITRQQVEHVDEAITDMRAAMADALAAAPAPSAALEPVPESDLASSGDLPHQSTGETSDQAAEALVDVTGFVADVCRLQSSQLTLARQDFVRAVEKIRERMRSVAANVRAETEAVGRIAQGEGGQETSVLDAIEGAIEKVVNTMREMAVAGEDVGRAMGEVAEAVREMTQFLESIEEVGAEIELIALNASVKAAHTGDEGAAMGVLAAATQSLSQEAGVLTVSVAEALTGIDGVAAELKTSAENIMDLSEVEALLERLEELTGSLRGVNKEIMDHFGRVNAMGEHLVADLESVVDETTFHLDVDTELSAAEERIDDLGRRARGVVPKHEDVNRSARLASLMQRYTMESERMVHETAFGSEGGSGSARLQSAEVEHEIELFEDDDPSDGVELFELEDGPLGAAADEEELGENIELF